MPKLYISQKFSSESDTTYSRYENEKGSWLSRLVEPCRDEAKLGEGFPPSPKQHGARAPAPQSGSVRRCAKPRHLGASSPSGNVRGREVGVGTQPQDLLRYLCTQSIQNVYSSCKEVPRMDPFRSGTKNSRTVEAQYIEIEFVFSARPAKKSENEVRADSSPDPSSARIKCKKQICLGFAKIHIPRK